MKWLICIWSTTLISIYPLQKLVVLWYKIILVVGILNIWTALFLFSDNILVIFQELRRFFFGGSLRAAIWLVALSRLLSRLITRRLIWSSSRGLINERSHHTLWVILRLRYLSIRSLILKYDLLRAPIICIICSRSASRLWPLHLSFHRRTRIILSSSNSTLTFGSIDVSLLPIMNLKILHIL
jgi:hypothetical protein